ncbi:hypothetical protein TcG_09156 [Trypanosoma cruzi]|nr:hypothetical protein TcG_09156 [Trypanosoma cruzi]
MQRLYVYAYMGMPMPVGSVYYCAATARIYLYTCIFVHVGWHLCGFCCCWAFYSHHDVSAYLFVVLLLFQNGLLLSPSLLMLLTAGLPCLCKCAMYHCDDYCTLDTADPLDWMDALLL